MRDRKDHWFEHGVVSGISYFEGEKPCVEMHPVLDLRVAFFIRPYLRAVGEITEPRNRRCCRSTSNRMVGAVGVSKNT